MRGGEDITLSCPESFAGTATLQAVHLAFETGPFATYDVAVWASGRPSRVVLSSAAGRISSVTDGEGKVVEREAGNQGARQLGNPRLVWFPWSKCSYSDRRS